MLHQIEHDILDCFGDAYMNKHLVYGILEAIILRLVPELAGSVAGQEDGEGEAGRPSVLLRERIGGGEDQEDADAEDD